MKIKIGSAWNPMTQMTPEKREEMDRREPRFLANYGKPDTRPRPRTFEERRAQIDETKRQIGNLNDVIAKGSGAIGAVWECSPLECDCQPKHKPRDGKWYPFKGSWADEKGLVRHPNGYWEDHEIPGQLSDCMCDARYIYDLEDAPSKTLT
jgi:hypothetical protein